MGSEEEFGFGFGFKVLSGLVSRVLGGRGEELLVAEAAGFPETEGGGGEESEEGEPGGEEGGRWLFGHFTRLVGFRSIYQSRIFVH